MRLGPGLVEVYLGSIYVCGQQDRLDQLGKLDCKVGELTRFFRLLNALPKSLRDWRVLMKKYPSVKAEGSLKQRTLRKTLTMGGLIFFDFDCNRLIHDKRVEQFQDFAGHSKSFLGSEQ